MHIFDFGIPFFVGIAMVEALASKTAAWEKENGVYFTYDGVSARCSSMYCLFFLFLFLD